MDTIIEYSLQLSRNIKEYREKAGFSTQVDAANALEVKRTTYASWENGDAEPSLAMIQRLADKFKTSPLNFLRGVLSFEANDIPDQDDVIEVPVKMKRSDIEKLSLNLNELGSVFSIAARQETTPRSDVGELPLVSGSKKLRQSQNKTDKQKGIS